MHTAVALTNTLLQEPISLSNQRATQKCLAATQHHRGTFGVSVLKTFHLGFLGTRTRRELEAATTGPRASKWKHGCMEEEEPPKQCLSYWALWEGP